MTRPLWLPFIAAAIVIAVVIGSCTSSRPDYRAVVTVGQQTSVTPEAASIRSGLESIASTYKLSRVSFRLEDPARPAIEVAILGGTIGDRVALGSISKSVTAIGIALLIQQGKLRLDTKLGDILAEYFTRHGSALDPSLRPITIERLLTHRAGLRTNILDDPVHGLDSTYVTSRIGGNRHFFNYIAVADAAKSNGSTRFVYSNLS